MPIGVHWNPFTTHGPSSPIKPYVAVSVGPYFGDSTGSFVGGGTVSSGVHTEATVGTVFGGGVDFHLGRPFMIGVDGGYRWMAAFSRPVGGRSSYNGAEVGLTFGLLFGRGR
jgi:hypothetical protein